ncbi:transposase [Polaromonas sp. CG_9.11]|uniref:IS66-like element accessory protein TnpA n=1 Tax=Polaromonas sp. CG_9.11 TaxID=2787730 RepID=UPI001A251F75|nr:transposase [Polaromonas sp. CG_9.11]MBG6078134.1 transposase [Polaromonas sp. CG_9.11]
MASETRTTQVPKRRFYSLELKLQVVQICACPGASIAAVALQHGINANIVHRWIREHSQGTLVTQPQAFVPVTLSTQPEPVASQPVAVAATAEIRMELRRGTSSMTVMWPSDLAGDCGAWLREWLR